MKKRENSRFLRFTTLLLALCLMVSLTACHTGSDSTLGSTDAGQTTASTSAETETETASTETAYTEPVETKPTETVPAETVPDETVPSETVPDETQPTVPEGPEITEITMTFVGDCTFGRNQKHTYANSFDEYYDNYGASYFFDGVRNIFENDDITVINLEGSLTTSTDIQQKLWNHKGDPKYVKIMTGSSVEVATMGNNHRLDYGESGFLETVDVLENADISYCYDSVYLTYEVKGVKVGFVSVNEVYDGWKVESWLKEGYQTLRDQGCAIVVACVHWGGDKTPVLEDYQIQLGYKLIDMGYDLVVGNHPHVLQAIQVYKGRFICYSLGNFCYGGSKNPADKDSGIFQQTFTLVDGELVRDTNAQFIPCTLSSVSSRNDYQPTLVKGAEFQRIIEKINGYSEEFGFALDSKGYPLRVEGKVDADHTHSYTTTVVKPTCTAQGYTLKKCICGESSKSNYTQATGHQYGTYTGNNDATCTKDGTKTAVCKTCGANSTVTDPGSAKGHSYTDTVVQATCTSQGYTLHQCSRCGDSYKDHDTALGEHTYKAAQTVEATMWEQGYTVYTCESCGDTYKGDYVDKIPQETFQRMVAQAVVQYINQYRAEQGTAGVTGVSGLTQTAESRAVQLQTNFEYSAQIDAAETIARSTGGTDPDEIGRSIADRFYTSNDWIVIGGAEYRYIGVGVSYKDGEWFICVLQTMENNG